MEHYFYFAEEKSSEIAHTSEGPLALEKRAFDAKKGIRKGKAKECAASFYSASVQQRTEGSHWGKIHTATPSAATSPPANVHSASLRS